MNGKKARRLRKQANFHPTDDRKYGSGRQYHKGQIVLVKTTRESTGARKRYQALKKR